MPYIALAELLNCNLLTANTRLSRAAGIRCAITTVPAKLPATSTAATCAQKERQADVDDRGCRILQERQAVLGRRLGRSGSHRGSPDAANRHPLARMARHATTGPGRRARGGVAVTAAVVAALSLALTACGGSSAPNVARVGSSTSSPALAPANPQEQAVAFARCMTAHGIPTAPGAKGGGFGFTRNSDPSSPLFRAAVTACQKLLPTTTSSGGPASSPQTGLDLLKLAACMRKHGVLSYPDPTFADGHYAISLTPGIDPQSPRFQAAQSACDRYFPGRLRGAQA